MFIKYLRVPLAHTPCKFLPLTTTSHYLICVVDFAGGTELTISADSVEQIKKHMALSLQRMQELEDQVRLIPVMQVRIKGHKV